MTKSRSPPPKSPNPTEKTKSQRNRSPANNVFTATFIAPNQLFIFIAPNQLLIFTATFIATYIPTISCLSDRLVSVSSLLSTLLSPSLAQPVALVTPSLSNHRPPNPQPPTNLSSWSLALNSLSLGISVSCSTVTPVSRSLWSLRLFPVTAPQIPNPKQVVLALLCSLVAPPSALVVIACCGEDGIPQFDREENKMADLNTMESRTEFEEQKRLAWDLQNRIEDSNSEVVGQRHQFSFDKVFNPEESQEEVFAEISQLVENDVYGHKADCLVLHSQNEITLRVLDLSTLTWSRVEAKAAVDSVESSSPVPLAACAGHSLVHLQTIQFIDI
ncbi:hypothetical protein Syun_027617 [Stephania yunnanensis]|uniref:Spindle pole body-associated protein Vik1/Cik1 microtubule binding domain-containing protein n=1 Tax=Stephania yunnanensis TaxID=152371 RepID=A0AAP0EFW4_9MAGN